MLVPHKITALEQSNDPNVNTLNTVSGAVVSLFDSQGQAVLLYDDESGSNPSTTKTTDSSGQVVVWVTPGEYDEAVNGSTLRRVSINGNQIATVDTFANLQLLRPVNTGATFVCQERANAQYTLQSSGYVAQTGDVTFTNGRVAALQFNGYVFAEWFTSIQDAVDRMGDAGGGDVYAFGRYTLTETLVLRGDGVTLKGAYTKNVFSQVVSNNDNGVIYADFTSGPAVLISDGGCSVKDITIQGSASRRAATITTGSRNSNSGILIETDDNGTDIIQSVEIENVRCVSHPADGLLIEADCTNVRIINFYSNDLGRHGLAITEGDIGGRTNKALPGIIVIENGKSFDCGGHGLVIGHPDSTGFPYRVTVVNREGYRLALDPAQRYSTAGNFVVGQDVEMINCAFGGTTTGNVPNHEGLEVGGRDIRISGGRYINCANGPYVIVRQQANLSTRNLEIDGGIAFTTGTVDDFATIANGADGVHILRVTHDCTNPVTDIAYNSNNSDIVLHDVVENLTLNANHTYDFTDSEFIRNNNGGGLSISSANVTITHEGFYTIDTEGDTPTDSLSSILGGRTGDKITLRQENSARTVTINDAIGNIRLAGSASYTFPNTSSYITFMLDGARWQEISRSEN